MLELTERGEPIAFSFEDVLRYHGGHSPGGAAIAYKVLEAALPLLGGCDRREIEIATAFGAERDAAQEARLTVLKRALAERVLARPAGEVLERASGA